MQIFNNNEGIIDELKININDLKPIDALNIINELKIKLMKNKFILLLLLNLFFVLIILIFILYLQVQEMQRLEI